MRILTKARAFNPHLAEMFLNKIPYYYSRAHMADPEACQKILDKLDLKSKYDGSKLDIVDVNPGYGLFSTMLNYELKPRNHILIENKERCVTSLSSIINKLVEETGHNSNFTLYKKDSFIWETYNDLIDKDKLIQPQIKSFDTPHDELLILANWTGNKEESVLAQWIKCCGHRNWLMKYGKVRMVIFAPSVSAMKFLGEPGFKKRRRTGLKRALYTDSRLIGVVNSEKAPGLGYDARVLVRDQPVLLEPSSAHRDEDYSVIEISPGKYTASQIENIEHFLLAIYLTNKKLVDILPTLAPGAMYMAKDLPEEMLQKSSYEFTCEDIIKLSKAYENWPFKPSVADLYDFDITFS